MARGEVFGCVAERTGTTEVVCRTDIDLCSKIVEYIERNLKCTDLSLALLDRTHLFRQGQS